MKKSYRCLLEVKTPTFIGSGEEVGKKEVIVDGKNNRFIIINPVKLFKQAKNKDLMDELEDYYINSTDNLTNWLRKNSFTENERELVTQYSVIKGEHVFNWEKNKKPVNIQTFIKDPYLKPYIPGSSIKGALRTAHLGGEILVDDRGLTRLSRIDASSVEKTYFGIEENNNLDNYNKSGNSLDDIFRGLQISDSLPLNTDDLICLQQVSFKAKPYKGNPFSELPIYREYLLPGTRIEFTLSIDSNVFPYELDQLLERLDIQQKYYEDSIRPRYIDELREGGRYIILGGGTGYASKSVTHPLFKEDYRRIREFARDLKKGNVLFPSQLRGVRYEGKVYEAGLCSWQVHQEIRD